MATAARFRLVLFVAVSALLLLSAVALSSGGTDSESGPAPVLRSHREGEMSAWARRVEARVRASAARLRAAARPFLEVFALYEVGEVTPEVRAGLRETVTPRFARELLSSPPRRPEVGGLVGAAWIEQLEVRFVSADASRALVSGRLRRGALPEEFAFLFVHRRGAWLASGPGE